MESTKKSDWKLLCDFLKKRRKTPWRNPAYVIYFIIVIILVGTFGVFKELIETTWCWSCGIDTDKVGNFSFNISSTGLSLVTASVIDLIFISKNSIEKETLDEKYDFIEVESIKRSIRFFGLGSLILTFVLWILINGTFKDVFIRLFLSIVTLIFSYFIWWISNVRNKILNGISNNALSTIGGKIKTEEETTPVGGTTQENSDSSPNVPGDISNFKS